jgi:hypothetical protein
MTFKSSSILTQFAILSFGASSLIAACSSSSDAAGGGAGSAGKAGSSAAGAAQAGAPGSAGSTYGYPSGGADPGAGTGGAQTGDAGAAGAIDSAGAAGTDNTAGQVGYVADLEGYSQNPRVVTSASGSATLVLSADKKTLSYHIKQTVTNATKAHIHLGAAGENGAVVYPLAPLSADMTGTIALTGASDLENLDAGKFYINVHSTADADGEIRGQILHPNEMLYVAALTAGQETPPNAATSSGTAQVIVNADKLGFRYHVQSTITAPTAAHIHKGIANVAGAPVHPFTAAQTIDGAASFAAGEADDLAQGRWYVNVHTAANVAGEIRGQLMLPGETLYSALLSGANETPPVVSDATGRGQFILSPDQKSIRYELALFGLTPTLAHIHKGAVAVAGPVVYPLMLLPTYTSTPAATAGAFGTLTITAADLTDLDAGNWYANAHSTAFPMGATRGQLTAQ